MKALLLVLALGWVSANAQDPGAMAAQQAQQAMDAAQQANQQAIQSMQAAQQANQPAMQASQDAALNSGPVVYFTAAPTFSVRASEVAAGTTVRLKSRTHYAVIYYTTNGWTPTTSSKRYKGPITLRASTQLQAIAIAPSMNRSLITSAKYTVPGTPSPSAPSALTTDGVLHAGTRLHLVTDSSANSKTAQIGDPLKLLLNQDVKVGNTIVLPKGTPVEAVITQADPAGHAGTPGDVAFEVHSLTTLGKQISLKGGESLEGANHYTRAKSLLIVPVVGIASLAFHGDEAEIKPGMTLTASVADDTPLQP
jgi:hypothetical protein